MIPSGSPARVQLLPIAGLGTPARVHATAFRFLQDASSLQPGAQCPANLLALAYVIASLDLLQPNPQIVVNDKRIELVTGHGGYITAKILRRFACLRRTFSTCGSPGASTPCSVPRSVPVGDAVPRAAAAPASSRLTASTSSANRSRSHAASTSAAGAGARGIVTFTLGASASRRTGSATACPSASSRRRHSRRPRSAGRCDPRP